jgi:hypothetical protein
VVQVVECLPSKPEALSLKKKKKISTFSQKDSTSCKNI